MYNSVSLTLVCLYRPPHSKQNKRTNKMFLDQFPDFLLSLSDGTGEIIVGDLLFASRMSMTTKCVN